MQPKCVGRKSCSSEDEGSYQENVFFSKLGNPHPKQTERKSLLEGETTEIDSVFRGEDNAKLLLLDQGWLLDLGQRNQIYFWVNNGTFEHLLGVQFPGLDWRQMCPSKRAQKKGSWETNDMLGYGSTHA